ncbi:hypothetical protein SK571_08235 [Lentzea sp. BCCO 10_0798]|uniref:Uncharacterized protein n=1 Tax=Lentzea kristufekii TaxID=3095430 RepID=A0ABU4TND9_9PSEU|nr:hypothetical protein [Lentzea sp. BCCO 10_0798]MDX8049366.1 hypothetical protein [Lentzea sp. BCCO 10_0798]
MPNELVLRLDVSGELSNALCCVEAFFFSSRERWARVPAKTLLE